MDNGPMVLIQALSDKPYLTLKDIGVSAGITRRQVVYRIERVNDLLRQRHASIITIGTAKEIQSDSKARQKLEELPQEMNQSSQYYMNKKECQIYVYLMLLMNNEYLSLSDFTDSLGVNRNTVLLDLKELTQMLEERDIRVRNSQTEGYYPIGSEMEVRRMMIKYVIYTLVEEQSVRIFDAFIDDFNLDTFGHSRLAITEFVQRHNIRFAENRLMKFIYVSIFLKACTQSRKNIEEEIHALLDMGTISSMKEHEPMVELLKSYKNADNITNTDINYIFSWVLGASFGDIGEETEDCTLISDIIGKIMICPEYLSGAHYRSTEEIFTQLYSHFRPAYYRLLCHLPIPSPLCNKVRGGYRKLYQLVEETMKPSRVIFGGDIPAGEIAHLTMHFVSIYPDRKAFGTVKQKAVLVVCSSGIGSPTILYNGPTGTFPELYFLPPLEISHTHDVKEYVGTTFSTSYVSSGAGIHALATRTSLVMSIAERYQVMREVYVQIGSHSLKRPNVDVVVEIVAKHVNTQNEYALYNELITYFSHVDMTIQEEHVLYPADMVEPELIRLHMDVDHWEEAVRKAYGPMVQHGYVMQNHVEEAISSVKVVGPYITITKHVALPHVRSEARASSVALGIGISDSTIESGNHDNDPVKYILSLSVIDNRTHLYAMVEFPEMLNKQEFLDMLDQAENNSQVTTYSKESRQ